MENPDGVLSEPGAATIKSFGGLAFGLGKYTGKLILKFDDTIPANTTTYVKIEFNNDALNALLGGNLGGVLASLLGNILLGNHYFTVDALLNSNPVFSAVTDKSSIGGFTDSKIKIIINKNGDYLLSITPSGAYNRITIEDKTNALLLGTTNSMKVHYAYYTTGEDIC